MSRRAWRLVKAAHAATAFDGEGARRYGGRWNSPGVALVYTSESLSLAALELLVHLQSSQLLERYVAIPVELVKVRIETVATAVLPPSWQSSPAPAALQAIGDRWARERRTAILRVPSALVPAEHNFLLNPEHADFVRLATGEPQPFRFDTRLS